MQDSTGPIIVNLPSSNQNLVKVNKSPATSFDGVPSGHLASMEYPIVSRSGRQRTPKSGSKGLIKIKENEQEEELKLA